MSLENILKNIKTKRTVEEIKQATKKYPYVRYVLNIDGALNVTLNLVDLFAVYKFNYKNLPALEPWVYSQIEIHQHYERCLWFRGGDLSQYLRGVDDNNKEIMADIKKQLIMYLGLEKANYIGTWWEFEKQQEQQKARENNPK